MIIANGLQALHCIGMNQISRHFPINGSQWKQPMDRFRLSGVCASAFIRILSRAFVPQSNIEKMPTEQHEA